MPVPEPFRFVFMADCQFGCHASLSGLDQATIEAMAQRDMQVRSIPPTEGFAWELRRFERAVEMANDADVDFVVMGGDMVHDPADEDQYAAVRRVAAGLDVPMHWVPGNHDVGEDTNVPTDASMAAYRARYGPDHYVFVHKGATVVVVDTTVWTATEALPGEWEAQLAALADALAAARDRGGPILVCGHHPLFVDEPDEPDTFWNVPGARRAVVLDLLVDHGVDIWLCGHRHRNGLRRHGRLEIATTGPVGFPLGDDPSGFRLVEVSADGIRHAYVPLTDVDPLEA